MRFRRGAVSQNVHGLGTAAAWFQQGQTQSSNSYYLFLPPAVSMKGKGGRMASYAILFQEQLYKQNKQM